MSIWTKSYLPKDTESLAMAGVVVLTIIGGLAVGHSAFHLWLRGRAAEATVLSRSRLESPTGTPSWHLKLRYVDADQLVHELPLAVDDLTHDRYAEGETVPLTVLDGSPPMVVLRGSEMNAKVAAFLVSLIALVVTALLTFTALTTPSTGRRPGRDADEPSAEDAREAEAGQVIGGLVESSPTRMRAGKETKGKETKGKESRGKETTDKETKGEPDARRPDVPGPSRPRRLPSFTTAGLTARLAAAAIALAVILSCWTDARIAASGRITTARFKEVVRMVRRGRGPSYAIARFTFKQPDGTVSEFEDRGTSMIEFKPAGTSFKAFVLDGSSPAGTIHLSRPGRSMIFTLLAIAFLLVGALYTFAEPLGLVTPSEDTDDDPGPGARKPGPPSTAKPGKPAKSDQPTKETPAPAPVKIQLRPQAEP